MRPINLLDENLVLWNNFRAGDADAFGELMRLHYNDLYNYGSRFTREAELVKDCIQDLFLVLWKNRTTINETSFVKYYLLKSLRRKLNKEITKRKNSLVTVYSEFEFGGLFIHGQSVEQKIILEENLSALAIKMRRMLANLSRRQQEVIYLRFYMDADIEEIADIISLNRQSVYNLLHDALKRLKKLSAQKDFSFSGFLNLWVFSL